MARIMSDWIVFIDGKEADVKSVTHVAEVGCVEVVLIKIYPREYRLDNETKTITIDGLYKKVD